jgi:hypothetical protein
MLSRELEELHVPLNLFQPISQHKVGKAVFQRMANDIVLVVVCDFCPLRHHCVWTEVKHVRLLEEPGSSQGPPVVK